VRTVGAEQRQKQAAADAALMAHHFGDASNPFFEIADRQRVLAQVGRFAGAPRDVEAPALRRADRCHLARR
jgi:hypothetical protein